MNEMGTRGAINMGGMIVMRLHMQLETAVYMYILYILINFWGNASLAWAFKCWSMALPLFRISVLSGLLTWKILIMF